MISPAMEVTREVIKDLWPSYMAGTVSPATRALVEKYLAEDAELARVLSEPEHTEEARGWPRYRWLLLLAMLFSCFAFGRIVSDTSWDVSPAGFAVTALIAGALWIAFLVSLARQEHTLARR